FLRWLAPTCRRDEGAGAIPQSIFKMACTDLPSRRRSGGDTKRRITYESFIYWRNGNDQHCDIQTPD
ncbi:MAG: hypothetical protein Q4C50_13020, partial [Eubacteriales bacterium]|nr:hypothetical protein [Eubacteriales bacterium]